MTDILGEGALGTAAAARWLNAHVDGGRYSPISIWRFITKGCSSASGQKIFLEHAKLGRRLMTSGPALARFAAKLADTQVVTTSQNISKPREELKASGFFS